MIEQLYIHCKQNKNMWENNNADTQKIATGHKGNGLNCCLLFHLWWLLSLQQNLIWRKCIHNEDESGHGQRYSHFQYWHRTDFETVNCTQNDMHHVNRIKWLWKYQHPNLGISTKSHTDVLTSKWLPNNMKWV